MKYTVMSAPRLCRRRPRLAHGPLGDGHRLPPAREAADRHGVRDGQLHQFTAVPAVSVGQCGLRLQGDRVDHQPAAGGQRRPGRVQQARRGQAATDEHRVGGGQSDQRRRGGAGDHPQARHAERRRVAGDPLGPLRDPFHRHGAAGGVRTHPLDADRARAAADVPQQFAGGRGERAQGRRADVPFGELAVVFVGGVGQAGGGAEPRHVGAGVAPALHGDHVQGVAGRPVPGVGVALVRGLVLGAELFQHPHPAGAEAPLP